VYAELNRLAAYREEELRWFEEHLEGEQRVKEAPFRGIVMHQPFWGWVDATMTNLKVTLTGRDGSLIESFEFPARHVMSRWD